MFKLVVLCAFVAAVVAEPSAIIAPLAYSAKVISPASTTISHQASSVIHPSPLLYSTPLAYSSPLGYAHFIKKRSVGFTYNPFIAPVSYLASTPLKAYSAPLATYTSVAPLATTYSSPLYTAAHLIKKRSAPVILPTSYSYVAPTAYAAAGSIVTPYAHSVPFLSSPVISSAPLAYSHFIKKRSVPLAITYAPAAFSQQSRVDLRTSPVVTTHFPFVHSSPIAVASYY